MNTNSLTRAIKSHTAILKSDSQLLHRLEIGKMRTFSEGPIDTTDDTKMFYNRRIENRELQIASLTKQLAS